MKKKIQKPFDVEVAKKGAKVETRDGQQVRVICYDRLGIIYPVIALLKYKDIESCLSYTIDGKLYKSEDNNKDLVVITEIETKFNEGDYIVDDIGCIYEITKIDDMYHTKQLSSGYEQRWTIEDTDRYFHKWAIQDAKPGDVLVCEDGDRPFIFKDCVDKEHPESPVAYCGINEINKFIISTGQHWWTSKNVRPATYKERQQFFNRLEEEGYKWDAESLTLSKIQKRWRDNEKADINGYYIDGDSSILAHSGYNSSLNHNVFVTEKQAKSALAMARISQIMANDERFGGVVTNEEWSVNTWRYVILRKDTTLGTGTRYCYEYLAFHTGDQARLFLKENEDLIKDYYMMD